MVSVREGNKTRPPVASADHSRRMWLGRYHSNAQFASVPYNIHVSKISTEMFSVAAISKEILQTIVSNYKSMCVRKK